MPPLTYLVAPVHFFPVVVISEVDLLIIEGLFLGHHRSRRRKGSIGDPTWLFFLLLDVPQVLLGRVVVAVVKVLDQVVAVCGIVDVTAAAGRRIDALLVSVAVVLISVIVFLCVKRFL